ncbi:MAG: hypothetical protein E3J72_07980 [Planctomycetota bacterium]|nr:MAG: hypothetical protein E3J72_07980 [Planctomycetota bacterium]
MGIEIICGKCSMALTVDDSHAGKKGRCPRCGSIMRIPLPGASAQASGPGPAPHPAQPPTAPPPKPQGGLTQRSKTESSAALAVGSNDSVKPYAPPAQPPPSGTTPGQGAPPQQAPPQKPPPSPAPPGKGTGMFCQDCNRELLQTEPIQKVGYDLLCGDCYNIRFGYTNQKTGDNVLDEIGLNIPGLVVLRGQQEREIGRLMQDASAKDEHRRDERKEQQKSGEVNCEIPVAKLLAKAGILQREMYVKIKKFQRIEQKPIFEGLQHFQVVDPSQLAQMMSEATGIPFLQADELPVDPTGKALLSKETIQMYYVLPLSKQEETLNLAMVNPYDRDAIQDVERMTGLEISPVICTYPSWVASFQKHFGA